MLLYADLRGAAASAGEGPPSFHGHDVHWLDMVTACDRFLHHILEGTCTLLGYGPNSMCSNSVLPHGVEATACMANRGQVRAMVWVSVRA